MCMSFSELLCLFLMVPWVGLWSVIVAFHLPNLGAKWLSARLDVDGLQVRASLEALRWVLKQDTLSSA